jgi:membrane protein
MREQTPIPERPDHKKTQQAVQHAVSEVEHAMRPRRDGIVSWAVALGAGAIVAWRSIRAALQDSPVFVGDSTGDLPKGIQLEPDQRLTINEHTVGLSNSSTEQEQVNPVTPTHRNDTSAAAFEASPSRREAAAMNSRGAIFGLAKEFIARYNDDDCPARAAALSFFGILSLVPLLLFAVAALGFFIHDPNQAQRYVEHVVATLLPGREATRAAEQVIQQTNLVDSARSLVNGKWWTIVLGFLSLIYTAMGLFVSATDPMNAAWEVKETRGFIRLRLICLEVFAGAGLFFLLSLAISSGLWHPADAPWIVNALLSVLYEVIAVALNAAMFTLIYRFLPNTKVTWKAAASGGLVTGVLYEIAKKGFEFYLSHFGNFNNKMYGALGGIVLLVTWIYYGSMLLLAGAIIAKMYHEHKEEGGVRKRA